MNFLYLDIETIPAQSPAVRDAIRETIKPPGNIKKPESIAAWWDENGDTAFAEAVDKTGLDPAYGHICTIAWAGETGVPDVLHARTVEQEADVIRGFFAAMPAETWGAPCFVGHFISGFDLRFILCRAVVLGIRIPAVIPRDPKPWDKSVFDTMTAWAGARNTISMDRLCGALGLEGKAEGLDGSQVGKAWAEGWHEDIIRYCAADVERTRAIHQRFIAAGF
jgi:3'-5' exonuclease